MARGAQQRPPLSPLLHSSSASASPERRISLYHPSLRPLLFCRSSRQLLQAHAHLIVCGLFFGDAFAASRVLKAAADLGCLEYAALIFQNLRPEPDAFCSNILLKAKSRSASPLGAVTLFFELAGEGRSHNSFAFPPIFNACAKSRSLGDGEKCHGQAVKNGVDGVVHVQNALINMYASCGFSHRARLLFDEMIYKDVVSWNSMIDGLVKCGDFSGAWNLFDQMPERNVVSWNVMISGFLKGRTPKRGLELFREMTMAGLRGTMTTMVSVVTACGRLGSLKEGRSIHGFCFRNFLQLNLILETALVDMYSKCQRLDTARSVFDRVPEKNLISWNAMILGHCIHGRPEAGLSLFEEMLTTDGLVPDEVTFVGVLCACSRAGMLGEGKKYFDEMVNVYKVVQSFAHYWCMANLYASHGFVEEAEQLLRNMPEERESLVWGSMFWLCRIYNDVGPGEQIARRLIELEPSNSSFYVFLWNIYVAAGRWEDAGKVTDMMSERGLMCVPSRSLVDLTEIVHNFRLNDCKRLEMEGISMKMDEYAARFGLVNEGLVDSLDGG